ncbi:MAG: hypothetical protein ACJA1A_002780 [Saprospiraceae bacterium]|jgi:hypothetical protein|tara:strand:+ start:1260 stop:1655 length:396 start_codon:yes stop_codon:yes gene_type:complete
MSDNDFDKIREVAENHTIQPRSEAWEKLENKLKSKRTKLRMINYRNISVAAIMISILSVTAVFSMYLKDHNPQIFASNEEYRPIVLEELSAELVQDQFYDIAQISKLNEAYANEALNFNENSSKDFQLRLF